MKKIIIAALALITMTSFSCAQKKAPMKKQVPIAATSVDYKIKTLPANVDAKNILKTILADYKGKVVLIDFWATWCGPCRGAMKEIDPLKKELASNKKMAFVYITGESSPEADWKAMLPSITGDHFRLTKDQWNNLCNDLGLKGIPSYMLIDKKGAIAYDNIAEGGYPGNEIIKAEIQKALK
ncbi:MAG: redoxin family protein [Bacteroidaceae bacterium]